MNTFIYVNGRPDHQRGQHDDLIMGISMAIYVGESSFTKLEKVAQQAKVMLESWTVASNDSVAKEAHFNPLLPNMNVKRDNFGREINAATKDDYIKYGWLFGGR